jgi:hypothetical protein
MLVWTVPIQLDMYLEAKDRERAWLIPLRFSDLLESEPGPIFEASLPDPEYRELVMRRYEELSDAIGSTAAPVKYGQLFSVRSFAEQLLAKLTARDLDADEIPRERLIFEAATGTDCRPFFDADLQLQPLAAAAVVEGFLESPDAAKYEPGVRYFFGHRIPD